MHLSLAMEIQNTFSRGKKFGKIVSNLDIGHFYRKNRISLHALETYRFN